MEALVRTPHGLVRANALQILRSTFDTSELLEAVDGLDRLCGNWKQELRDELLRVHAMAHTVVNDAPLSCAPGGEGLGQAAVSIMEEFEECRDLLKSVVSLLSKIATLAPN